ncbi:MAG: 50S ribosomal protein L18 [Candidatus Marinimicrobia bacterium]|nr:50S ribosomal protein L18 [Candidatus Neomarinimicrobiota bacterium]
MKKLKSRKIARTRRKKRIRKHIHGTAERPRLAVFRSLKHIYAQLIDDTANRTLFSVSDLSPKIKTEIKEKATNSEKSVLVGKYLAEKALAKKIRRAVFDRSGFKYHGRVKLLAEAAREAGLEL